MAGNLLLYMQREAQVAVPSGRNCPALSGSYPPSTSRYENPRKMQHSLIYFGNQSKPQHKMVTDITWVL